MLVVFMVWVFQVTRSDNDLLVFRGRYTFIIIVKTCTGTIKPLPPIVYSLVAAPAALRQLSAAKHIGKIVVEAPAALPVSQQVQFSFSPLFLL